MRPHDKDSWPAFPNGRDALVWDFRRKSGPPRHEGELELAYDHLERRVDGVKDTRSLRVLGILKLQNSGPSARVFEVEDLHKVSVLRMHPGGEYQGNLKQEPQSKGFRRSRRRRKPRHSRRRRLPNQSRRIRHLCHRLMRRRQQREGRHHRHHKRNKPHSCNSHHDESIHHPHYRFQHYEHFHQHHHHHHHRYHDDPSSYYHHHHHHEDNYNYDHPPQANHLRIQGAQEFLSSLLKTETRRRPPDVSAARGPGGERLREEMSELIRVLWMSSRREPPEGLAGWRGPCDRHRGLGKLKNI